MWRIWVALTILFVLTACQEKADVESPSGAEQQIIIEQEPPPTSTPIVIRMTATPKPTLPTIQGALDAAIMVEGHHPQRPFAIHFTQPIDLNSVNGEGSIHINPAIEGDMVWSDGYQTATFTPETEFAAGETYTIQLHPNLKGRSGLGVEDQSWQLTMLTYPKVRGHQANTDDMLQPIFTLDFDSEMDFFTLANAISVEPDVPLQVVQEQGQIVVRPQELIFDERYNFSVDLSALAVNGLPLAQPYTWQYYIEKVVQQFYKPTQNNPNFEIKFNYPIDKESLHFSVEPPMTFDMVWRADDQLLLQPTTAYPGDQVYTMSFADGLKATDGTPLPQIQNTTFDMPNLVMHDMPTRDLGNLRIPLTINFEIPMNTTLTEQAVTIDPPTAGNWTWNENNTIASFQPTNSFWQAGTAYEVTVSETAVSAANQPILANPYQFSFATEEQIENIARFDRDGDNLWQTIPANEPIPFHYIYYSHLTHLAEVDFSLQQLDMTTWLTSDREQPLGTGPTWQHSPIQQQLVQTTTLPSLSGGIYRLTIAGSQPNEDSMTLFVAQHALALNHTSQGDVIWLTDWQSNPIASANIEVWLEGAMIATGQTDEQGLYTTNVPEGAKIVAKQGDEITAFMERTSQWQSQFIKANTTQFVAQTSQPVYQVGDEVPVYVIARTPQGDPVPNGTNVTARLYWYDSQYYGVAEKVAEWSMTTSHFGTATGSWQSDFVSESGYYELLILHDGAFVARTPFRLLSLYLFEQNITLQTAQPYYAIDLVDPIITGQWFGTDGQPVANRALRWEIYSLADSERYNLQSSEWIGQSRGGIKTVETDENGRFTLDPDIIKAFIKEKHPFDFAKNNIGIRIWNHAVPSVEAFIQFQASHHNAFVEGLTIGSANLNNNTVPVSAWFKRQDGTPLANQSVVFSLYNDELTLVDDPVLSEVSATTDAYGFARANLPFETIDTDYTLRARSWDEGREFYEQQKPFISSDSTVAGIPVTMFFEQSQYEIGQTARLIIQVPEATSALLTIVHGEQTETTVIPLQAPQTILDIPVTEANTQWVMLQTWQPVSLTTKKYYRYAYNPYILRTLREAIPLNPAADDLTLTVTWDKETYEAGETAVFTLRATNNKGEPVSAELMVSLYDAVWAVYPQQTDSYRLQTISPSGFRLYHTMSSARLIAHWCEGCGDYDEFRLGPAPFNALLGQSHTVWLPNLVTNANGEVTISLPLPTAGTWQLEVHAITADTQIGTLSTTVMSQ